MKYINSTMHHTILCKSIGGFRGGVPRFLETPYQTEYSALSMWSQSLDGSIMQIHRRF